MRLQTLRSLNTQFAVVTMVTRKRVWLPANSTRGCAYCDLGADHLPVFSMLLGSVALVRGGTETALEAFEFAGQEP